MSTSVNYLEIARRAIRERNENANPRPEGATIPEPPLESILKGSVIELWCDRTGDRFWLVADEDDAGKLGESRGNVYTAVEARRIIRIKDPKIVAEVHCWKRKMNAVISGHEKHCGGC